MSGAGWVATRIGFETYTRGRLGWKGLTADEYVDEGVSFLSTPDIKGRDIDFDKTSFITRERYEESPEIMLRVNDVLLTKDGSTIGTVNIVSELPRDATVNSSIAVLTPKSELAPRFLFFLLQSTGVKSQIEIVKSGMGVPHLFQSDLKRISFSRPSLAEQTSIVGFLDRETAQIDELIAKQEQLVLNLELRKIAVVRRILTGSDNSSVSRTKSGSPWWGTLPQHWKEGKVGHHFEVTLGKMLDEKKHQPAERSFPYIRAANIQEDALRLGGDALLYMTFSEPERMKYALLADDLLVVEGGAIGVNQYLTEDLPDTYFQKTVNRVRSRGKASTRYLGFALDVLRVEGILDMSTNKSTIAHFTAEKLNQTRIPLPPREEQDEIVRNILRATETIQKLKRAATEMIALLKERRQALISAAVTGKIDVTGKV